jgi:sigma-B regulation protein RsbU (phosphoserine phosphatase)
VEAVNPSLELFSEDRLLAVANNGNTDDPGAFIADIKAAIDDFASGEDQFDDITLMAFRYDGCGNNELNIPADLGNLDRVLQFVTDPLLAKGCDKRLITQAEIVAEEIFVNIVRYAYPSAPGDAKIVVSVDEDIVLIFSDAGQPFDPINVEEPDINQSLEDREIGGLGILMVKKIMDDISYRYEDGRNILTLRMKL